MAQVAERPAPARHDAATVMRLRNEAGRAAARAAVTAERYREALQTLPVKELLALARESGLSVGHADRTREDLLRRLSSLGQ